MLPKQIGNFYKKIQNFNIYNKFLHFMLNLFIPFRNLTHFTNIHGCKMNFFYNSFPRPQTASLSVSIKKKWRHKIARLRLLISYDYLALVGIFRRMAFAFFSALIIEWKRSFTVVITRWSVRSVTINFMQPTTYCLYTIWLLLVAELHNNFIFKEKYL